MSKGGKNVGNFEIKIEIFEIELNGIFMIITFS